MADVDGNCIQDENSLKALGQSHFAGTFKDDGGTCLDHQLRVVMLFPKMISDENASNLTCPVSLGEIAFALNSFKKDRSLGLDGWPVEIYLHFFDLMGQELLSAVDSTRVLGLIPPSLNATFLTLIPKLDKPQTFTDFRPISLCNLLYKLIAKVIAVRLKPFLDTGITPEHFGFLKGRQITEPIGIVQEILHTVKTKNICAFILKLDLIKSFDRVN